MKNKDYTGLRRVGVDESGKGDYFGYLIVASVYVDKPIEKKLSALKIKDSKMLSDAAIRITAKKLIKICPHDIVRISPEKYNHLYKKFKNMNSILAWAHAKAIENMLERKKCDIVISDKFSKNGIKKFLMKNSKNIKLIQNIRAESDIAVASASIIARYEFLKTLKKLGYLVGHTLPKGSTHVEQTAKQIIKDYGNEILLKIAKMHFKITKRILT